MKITNKQILEKLSSMSLIEIIELINDIEKKFGINSNSYQFNNINNTNIKEDKKDEFDLYLDSIGKNKISVIKVIRNYLNLGLKEAKDLVESSPVLIKEKMAKKDLDILKKSLEEVGASILIK